jgi:hypothetical protein
MLNARRDGVATAGAQPNVTPRARRGWPAALTMPPTITFEGMQMRTEIAEKAL